MSAILFIPIVAPIAPNISSPIPFELIVAAIAPVIAVPISPIASGFAAKVSNAAVAAPTGNASKAPAIIVGLMPISATFIDAKFPASNVSMLKEAPPTTDSMFTIPALANPVIAVPIPTPFASKAPIIPFASNPAPCTALIVPANFCIATTFPAPICPAILDKAAISFGENSFPKSMPDISNDVGSGTASKAISATPSTNVIACTAPVISPFAKLS